MKKEGLFKDIDEIYSSLLADYQKEFKNRLVDQDFKITIDKYQSLDNIQTNQETREWNDDFCIKVTYLSIIKLLILKFAQDRGLIEELLLKDYSLRNIFKRLFAEFSDRLLLDSKWELLNLNEKRISKIEGILSRYNFKKLDTKLIGEIYQHLVSQSSKRKTGQFYTPDIIIALILKNTLKRYDILENPYLKILDPSCGSGYFLIEAYDILYDKYNSNLEKLKKHYPEDNWNQKKIHQHILENNLYGIDLDSFAIQLTIISLLFKGVDKQLTIRNLNIEVGDFLKLESKDKFDFILGNPPYVGHKELDWDYKQWLKENYSVYADKADLSYCFLEKGINSLKKNGELMMITSRYFLESPAGENLREYLQKEANLLFILDFYGVQLFDNVIVDSVIIKLSPPDKGDNLIEVIRLNNKAQTVKGENIIKEISVKKKQEYYQSFFIKQSSLDSKGWRLLLEKEQSIYRKIEDEGVYTLGEICTSSQGVITGYDGAFVISDEKIKEERIEKQLLRPWIKNRHITSYSVEAGDKYLIYSDLITSAKEFPQTFAYLSQFKSRLSKRRECTKGLKKWYQLQWGRKQEIFDGRKIVYPYKASENRFAIDGDGNYCSADVYLLVLKQDFKRLLTLESLIGLLNSKIYNFYFKSFAKKMSYELYDYYPNTVLQLKIKVGGYLEEIDLLVRDIITLKKEIKALSFLACLEKSNYEDKEGLYQDYIEFMESLCKKESRLRNLQSRIDCLLYNSYNLTLEEIKIIANRLRIGRYGRLEEQYLVDLASIDYRQVINNRFKLVNKVAKTLTAEDLSKLHHQQEKSLEIIAQQIGCEYQTLALLRRNYASKNQNPYRYYDPSLLKESIERYIAKKIEEILKEEGSYLTLEELYQRLIVNKDIPILLEATNQNKDKQLIIKDIIFARKYTWNQYLKRKEKGLKLKFSFINYEGYNFGLSFWENEHQTYFENSGL